MRRSDIHPPSFIERFKARFDSEIDQLLRDSSDFKPRDCPACFSADHTFAFKCRGFTHLRCNACRTIFISPCPMEAQIIRFLNTAESYRIWREEMPDEMRNSRMPMYRERAQHLLDKAGRPKSVLEVGAGNGEMLGLLKGEVPRLLAVDPQPLPVAIPGVEVICGSFADIKIPYAVDVVVAFEVFEHLVEPEKFLSFARRGLNAPGLLIMSMPNGCGFEISQLGPLSSSVPFDHVALYNPGSLKLLLERNGFCDVSIETPGRFDAEMVYDAFRLGQIKIEDPALRFVLTAGEAMRNDFQAFLREGRLSSHMRVVARAH